MHWVVYWFIYLLHDLCVYMVRLMSWWRRISCEMFGLYLFISLFVRHLYVIMWIYNDVDFFFSPIGAIYLLLRNFLWNINVLEKLNRSLISYVLTIKVIFPLMLFSSLWGFLSYFQFCYFCSCRNLIDVWNWYNAV